MDAEEKKKKKKAQAAKYYALHKTQVLAKNAAWRAANKEKIKRSILAWREKNAAHLSEYYARTRAERLKYKAEYRAANKSKLARYRAENKARDAAYRKQYREENKEKIAAYLAANKDRIAKRQSAYESAWRLARLKSDPTYKLRVSLRIRALHALKRQGVKKSFQSHNRLLGGTIAQARAHIESQFKPWMTWENHGFRGWHIDHIKPLSAFDLTNPAQAAKAFHYTNLRPLHWRENLSKGARLLKNKQIKKVKGKKLWQRKQKLKKQRLNRKAFSPRPTFRQRA